MNFHKKSLQAISLDLETTLVAFQRVFMMKNKQDLPVAFATNALYVLSMNGMLQSSGSLVDDELLPIIKQKK